MQTETELKQLVREKYAQIASAPKEQNAASCCGATCCTDEVYNIMADDYTQLEGYVADADLGLGCGLPTQFAQIKKGDTVIDLGSGAGNDAFIAAHETGETGKVIGIDFTPEMIQKAKKNAETRNLLNVEFIQGDIEDMPVNDNTADVVVSNCVLNLVPNKQAVMKEMYRVLKPSAHFSVSDIVLEGELPAEIKNAAEMYAGCVSGAVQKQDYLNIIAETGFANITVQKDKLITVPDDILSQYLTTEQLSTFKASGAGIRSLTVYAEKPKTVSKSCCGPECCN